VVQHIKETGTHAVGGGFGTFKGYFTKSFNQGNLRPEDEHLINEDDKKKQSTQKRLKERKNLS
jgi:hypothetical protein